MTCKSDWLQLTKLHLLQNSENHVGGGLGYIFKKDVHQLYVTFFRYPENVSYTIAGPPAFS